MAEIKFIENEFDVPEGYSFAKPWTKSIRELEERVKDYKHIVYAKRTNFGYNVYHKKNAPY